MTLLLMPFDGVAEELSRTATPDQCLARMTGLAGRPCDNRFLPRDRADRMPQHPPSTAQAVGICCKTNNLIGVAASPGAPLFLASGDVIHYPGQSAAAGIRSM